MSLKCKPMWLLLCLLVVVATAVVAIGIDDFGGSSPREIRTWLLWPELSSTRL